MLLVCGLIQAAAQSSTNAPGQTNSIQAEMDQAIHEVEKIVNQPVPAYRRVKGMHVSVSSPGWFHPGATKPDFNTVDVRTTQQTPYAQHQYITSDLNPGLVFIGSELEFNPMTKYFYTNRTLPKKKLTEAEMEEVNRLYRIIGRCEQQLAPAQNPAPARADEASDSTQPAASGSSNRRRLLNPYVGGAGIAVLALILVVSLSRRGR